MLSMDWTRLYKKYAGLWVALKDDEKTVVGSGATLKQALAGAEKKGYQHPIVHRVPAKLEAFVGINEVSL